VGGLLSRAQLKRANETTMDLEQTIDVLVYLKKELDLNKQRAKLTPSRQRPKGGRGVGYAFE
jgi:hypothetical protein